MTEAEWLANADAEKKLAFLGAKGTDRKLRLLAVAWCRQIESVFLEGKAPHHSVKKERRKALQKVVLIAEKFAEGQATKDDLNAAYWSADRFLFGDSGKRFGDVASPERTSLVRVHLAVNLTLGASPGWVRERIRDQLAALRDVFGDVFRPVIFSPAWRTENTVTLAKQMYESGDFSAMSVLSDALMDAGCESAGILEHCRDEGPHVRGCWVVDLILGKE